MSKHLPAILLAAALLAAIFYFLPDASDDQVEPPPTAPAATAEPRIGAEVVAQQAVREKIILRETAEQSPPAGPATVAVSGWIEDASGTGIGDLQIEIEALGLDGEQIVADSTRSNQRGEFSVELLPQRQYRLEIRPQRNFAAFKIDSLSIETAAALQPVVLQRLDLIDADGLIVDTGGAPVADFEMSVRSLWVDYPDRSIKSDASGYFRLEGFPAGAISIATNASDYYRIEGIELRPDEYPSLNLIIDRGGYHLGGLLRDSNGAPVAQAQVTLKSAIKSGDYHSYSYRSVVSDDYGAFEFPGLGGNQLTLGVYAAGFKTHIQRHRFSSFSDRVEIELRPELEPAQ